MLEHTCTHPSRVQKRKAKSTSTFPFRNFPPRKRRRRRRRSSRILLVPFHPLIHLPPRSPSPQSSIFRSLFGHDRASPRLIAAAKLKASSSSFASRKLEEREGRWRNREREREGSKGGLVYGRDLYRVPTSSVNFPSPTTLSPSPRGS